MNINRSIKLSKTSEVVLEDHMSPKFSNVVALNARMKVMPILSDYLRHSLNDLKRSVKTVSKQYDIIKLFVNFLMTEPAFENNNEDEALLFASEFYLKKYFEELSSVKELSSVTVANYDAQLHGFYGYIALKGFIDENPYEDGSLVGKGKSKLVSYCSFDEVFALISCTNNERERALIQFVYDSGLRVSEVPRVSVADIKKCTEKTHESIKEDGDVFVTSDYVALDVKGSKGRIQGEYNYRTTKISIPTLNRIKKYHSSPIFKRNIRKFTSNETTPAFLNSEGSPYTASSIAKLFTRVSNRALKRGLITRKITPHKLRHGFAYSVLQSNDEGTQYLDRLVQVQFMLGHRSLSTTQNTYTSIPVEIYKTMTDKNGEPITRAVLMKRLVEKTKIKIKVTDVK